MKASELIPEHVIKKLHPDELNKLKEEEDRAEHKRLTRNTVWLVVLNLGTALLLVWGYYFLLRPFDSDIFYLLFFVLSSIYSGGRMMIYGFGHMNYAETSADPMRKISLKGIGATIYGIIALIMGLILYLIFFTPFISYVFQVK